MAGHRAVCMWRASHVLGGAAPSTAANSSRRMPSSRAASAPSEAAARRGGRTSTLEAGPGPRSAAAEPGRRVGRVVGRRPGWRRRRARACSGGRRAAPRAARAPASGGSASLDAEDEQHVEAPRREQRPGARRGCPCRPPRPPRSRPSSACPSMALSGPLGRRSSKADRQRAGIGAPASSSTRRPAR